MARRLTWAGCHVKCVVEIMPHPSGLTRNIVQCLNDFDIPLYLSHTVSNIYWKDRVESVDILPMESGVLQTEQQFTLNIDTNVPGLFAYGNVLHVHDLVDFVSEESERCGHNVCDYKTQRKTAAKPQIMVNPRAIT